MAENTYTSLINRRAQEERGRREKERITKENLLKVQAAAGPPALARKRKGLNFHEPGTFVTQAEQLRKKAKLEALQKKIAERAAKTGITDAVKLASLTTSAEVKQLPQIHKDKDVAPQEEIPDVEWWDRPLLRGLPLDEVIPRLVQKNIKPEEIFEGITNLIEHPAIKKPPGPDLSSVQLPIFLTEKERKKLRRQNRKNLELEKQEKIKLGLLPKPEPKLKRSNIMHVLGEEAIVNPSKADLLVREQEEKRLQAHLDHNESKKLTLEQKRAKKLKKVQEDLSLTGTWVTVYRVLNLSSEAHKFKVIKNAKQLTMTGVVILHKNINLVVVEGGPKQQRKFKQLMMNRIQWNDETVKDNNGDKNQCFLVWEGQVNDRSFRHFKVRPMTTEQEIRSFFKQSHVEHYWDLAYKMSILETIQDL